MTKVMNKFNVAKYNEKINTLNKIIDTFNDTISNFSCWMDITPALVKELIYNPVKTHHKYLSFEKIVQYRCSEYEIEENDYFNPEHHPYCFSEIMNEMKTVYKTLGKFYELLPHIKKAYGSLIYLKDENSYKAKICKTQNAEYHIMQQCAEYIDTDYMNCEV